jgi:hypothetical protein
MLQNAKVKRLQIIGSFDSVKNARFSYCPAPGITFSLMNSLSLSSAAVQHDRPSASSSAPGDRFVGLSLPGVRMVAWTGCHLHMNAF